VVYKPVGTQCYTIQVTVFCLVKPCSCIRGYQLPQTRVRPHFLMLICCGPEKGYPPMFFFSWSSSLLLWHKYCGS